MAFSFTIDLTGAHIPAVLSQVRTQIIANKGTFEGDDSAGKFSGSGVVGNYTRTGSVITITITKKPFIAPESLVKSKIKTYFGVA